MVFKIIQTKRKTHDSHLWSEAWYVIEVHVAHVGQTHQCVFTVVFLSRGAEDHQRHLPHPTAFMRRQLELCFGADLRKREHLGRQRRK